MYKIAKNQLQTLFTVIANTKNVYLPVKKSNQVNYGLWLQDAEVDLDTLKTVKSPKDFFFPQSETLYNCHKEDGKIVINPTELTNQPFVVFGVKACDIKAIEILDKVFLSEPIDTYYAARREHGIVVSMACHEPDETCFCNVFGADASTPAGDVVVWQVEDSMYWKALTEKGESLTKEVISLLEKVSDTSPVEKEQAAIKEIIEKLPYSHLDMSKFTPDALDEMFNSPKWEQLFKACLACGTCTFVCPTCQCYDIKDYNTGKGVQRFRCWDSCMYSDFTMMAHGNPRTSQLQRFRQRFMHKLIYFPANNDGIYSCVGCGRCVSKCPASQNIVKVIKSLGGER